MLVAKLPLRPILHSIRAPLVLFTLLGMAAMVTHTAFHHPEIYGIDQQWADYWVAVTGWNDPGVHFGAISALGGALAIFLGFRNNSAYDRWWEARKIWGGLVNDSRSWARQVMAWSEGPNAAKYRKEAIHRHLAFVHGLALHLRGDPNLHGVVASFVSEEEAEHYASMPNIPTALLIQQGKCVAEARADGTIEHFRHLRLDDMLTRLSDIQGKCERIKHTPLPVQYDQIPRAFVYFYGLVLPFGLVGSMGWAAVPLSVAITLLFLLLEGAGRVIENPFEGLPMDTPMIALANTIERDLRAALGEEIPAKIVPDAYGVLM